MNLAELVLVDGSDPDRRIEYLHGAPVYRLRGRLLPIIDLTDLLRGGTGAVRSGAPGAAANIVVVQADDIARLEQFDASEIEHSRGNNVVQYRDRVMTLIDLAHAAPEAAYGSIAAAGPVPVLVLNNDRLDIGVTVNGITDIVDAKAFAQALTGSFDEPAVDVTDTTELV